MSKRTALYRHFDAGGALLYVGIALSPTYRLSSHRASSVWAQSIAHVTMEWFETREEAIKAEKLAIETERPAHNIVHNRPSGGPASTARATVPEVPHIVHSKEELAVCFRVGYAVVQRMIADGMPRTSMGGRKFAYDVGAIKHWLRQRYARKINAEQAAADKAREEAAMLEKMRAALMMIGAKAPKPEAPNADS